MDGVVFSQMGLCQVESRKAGAVKRKVVDQALVNVRDLDL